MTLDFYSGGRLDFTPFDLNGDRKFNSGDFVTLSDGTKVAVGGVGTDGIQSSPTILYSNDTAASASTGGGRDQMAVPNPDGGPPKTLPINGGVRHVGRQSWRQVR